MSADLGEAMRSLAAAAAACRLYFPGHPTVEANLQRACAALARVRSGVGGGGNVEVHAIDDRVVGPDGPLADGEALRAGLFDPLAKLGRTSLRLAATVTPGELRVFVEGLSAETPELRVTSSISAGVSGVGVGESVCSPSGVAAPVRASQLVERVGHVLRAAESGNELAGAELEQAVASVVSAVAGARGTMLQIAELKSHDEYTYVHTVNVALLSAALAEAVGLSGSTAHELTQSALLHDIGKRVIPLSILNKQGQLTAEERRIMQRHPVEGARLLMGRAGVPAMAPIVAFEHHMHLDGSGYPVGDRAWRPNLAAQIVQQADVFDALRTHRPYRRAMSTEQASKILLEGAGSKYDASLVDVYLQRVVTRTPASSGDGQSACAEAA